MNFGQHIWPGVIIGAVGAYFLYPSIENGIICIAFSIVAALLPDLDTNSKISNLALQISIVLAVLSFVFFKQFVVPALTVFVIVLALRVLVKHRTITHTLTIAACFTVAAYIITYSVIISACTLCSYLSHLILDKL